MEINNFTGQPIRIGEYPHSLDVMNIPGDHSSHGVLARFCTYRTPEDGKESFVQLRKRIEENNFWYELVLCKWGEQENQLDPAEIIWDSRRNNE